MIDTASHHCEQHPEVSLDRYIPIDGGHIHFLAGCALCNADSITDEEDNTMTDITTERVRAWLETDLSALSSYGDQYDGKKDCGFAALIDKAVRQLSFVDLARAYLDMAARVEELGKEAGYAELCDEVAKAEDE